MPGPSAPNLSHISGLCGPSSRPCKLVWHSQYPNQVGTYPEDLLPARRTIWHALDDGGYDFPPAITQRGDTFGLGILGFFTGSGLFGSDIEFDNFNPQSHVTIIFARTANRINIPHFLTQSEVDSLNTEKVAVINAGEYVFEAVAVTESPAQIDINLTDEEKIEVQLSGDAESDRAFRKLFTLEIAGNRLRDIKSNRLGVEYRLDNGGPKTNTVFDLPGAGDLYNANYRDGSSRELEISLDPANPAPPEDGSRDTARAFEAGDIVYLTYVAIKEHYIRQMVNVKHSFFAISLPPQCLWTGSTIKAANFRFYEWQIKPDDPQGLPVILGGWRAVEAINTPVNVNGLVTPFEAPDLATFIFGPQDGVVEYRYMPANDPDGTFLTVSQLQQFIDNRALLLITSANAIRDFGGGAKYPNPINDDFKSSAWYANREPTIFSQYADLIRHTYFNVHPNTMDKRDVDKVAFERSLADALDRDARAGKPTNFPFQDDYRVDNPFTTSFSTLSSSNLKFDPIQPASANFWADVECGVAGSVLLGITSAFGDVLAFFHIESPFISEPFDRDTRVLVERHFTVGGSGPQLITVEGVAGAVNAVSALAEQSGEFGFVCHSHDNFLVMNKFDMGSTYESFLKLTYRPDLPSPPVKDNNDPTPDQFESLIGYTGMLGDELGVYPGVMLSISSFMPIEGSKYKTTNKASIKCNGVVASQIEGLSIKTEDNKVILKPEIASLSTYHRTEIEYSYNGDPFDAMLIMKAGTNVIGVVDSIQVHRTFDFSKHLTVFHPWMQAETVEFVSKPDNMTITNATLVSINNELVADFLNGKPTSTIEDKEKNPLDKLVDKPIFFESKVMSLDEDRQGRIFCFFQDEEGGISCLQSDDYGQVWYFHYGIVEQIAGRLAQAPFVVHGEGSQSFLFFLFSKKIMCKQVDYSDFLFDDALLVERFEETVLERDEEVGTAVEQDSILSDQGRQARERNPSYVAAGDLNDEDFLKLTGVDLEGNKFDPFERRVIHGTESDSRRYPLIIGTTTAFTNKDIEEIHFSAYRKDNGGMRLFFLGSTKEDVGGGDQLQCRFSVDDGSNWFDLWEFIENGYNRLRADDSRKTQFIDRDAPNEPPATILGTDPQESNQDHEYGINLHWSRLKRHKIGEGDLTVNSESEVLKIESPYAFYQSGSDEVFIFYVYENCLLCKIVHDVEFEQAHDLVSLKQIIERGTKSYFIDGNLDQGTVREEIQDWVNEETNEQMADGNIIFPFQFGIDRFNADRNISAQRVCAYETSRGHVRIFYKMDFGLRSSIWNGQRWYVEEFLKDPSDLDPIVISASTNPKEVTGGFGSDAF